MTTEQNNVITSLSTREVQVLDFLSRGLTEKEIAGKLFISSATVNNHTRHIREKFGLSKNTEILLQYIAIINGKEFDIEEIRKNGIQSIL